LQFRSTLGFIEKLKDIKLAENISDTFWIHETPNAINQEFKFWSINFSCKFLNDNDIKRFFCTKG